MWQLPSWLLSLNVGEILSIFAYAMLDALSETLFILALALILAALLPPRFLRDDFTVRGSWIVIGLLLPLLIFFILFDKFSVVLVQYIFPWTIVTALLAASLAFLSARVSFLRSAALLLSDRLTIFLYLFVPLTVISLIAVAIRNIL